VAQVCTISGVVMSVLILLAPSPRVGYLLYPINFFVWAYLLAEPAQGPALLGPDDLAHEEDDVGRTDVAVARA